MICAVNNIIETLYNPQCRFRTLEGLLLDSAGIDDPVFSYGGAVANFRVRWRGKPYLLKCFLDRREEVTEALKRVSAYVSGLPVSYLVDYRYLGNEMLVFDDFDRAHWVDVVLMERPEGRLLGDFLSEAASRGDVRSLGLLVRAFCRLGAWLLDADLVHGCLKPANLLVTPELDFKLLNYERMQVPALDTFREKGNEDNLAVANLALALSVLAADPSSFRILEGDSWFRVPTLRSPLIPLFSALDGTEVPESVRVLVGLLGNGNYTLRDRLTLIRSLTDLAKGRGAIPAELFQQAHARLYAPAYAPASPRTDCPVGEEVLERYDWAGPFSEGLCCVERDGLWGFVDAQGREVIPLRYGWADDFREGRTVVSLDEGFALLDRDGLEVLPPVYESLEWNSAYGLVLAAYDGKMGIFDRNGREVVPMIYDWIGPPSPLILVRKGGLCGYIRPDGGVAIVPCYEDAFDFNEAGKALVVAEGREFFVDQQGREV